MLGPYSTDEQRNLWLAANGYLDPAYLRFLRWLGHFLIGDWGTSHVFNEPVATLIGERLANTAVLGAVFFACLIPLSLSLGVLAGMREGSKLDRAISVVCTQSFVPLARPGAHGPAGQFFLLGTDQLGRDVLSRLIFGARTVLLYAPLATFAAYLVGISAGLLAGYRRGWIDEALSRASDLVLAFPALVLYIAIIGKFGASPTNIVVAITLATSPGVMRIVRGLTLDVRSRSYIAAAQLRGESDLFIIFAEILPNVRGPLIVDVCVRLGYVAITIGTLGFLGLGLPPPTPDWGGMINEARQFAMIFPHMVIFPSLAIVSLVLGLNLLADGLREIAAND